MMRIWYSKNIAKGGIECSAGNANTVYKEPFGIENIGGSKTKTEKPMYLHWTSVDPLNKQFEEEKEMP